MSALNDDLEAMAHIMLRFEPGSTVPILASLKTAARTYGSANAPSRELEDAVSVSLWLALCNFLILALAIYLFIKNRYYHRNIKHLNKKILENERKIISQADPGYIDVVQYYTFVRDEIKHEDDITNQRLTWAITFQGFLIAAIGTLIGFVWSGGDAIIALRKVTLAVLPCIGIVFGIIAYNGIWASRTAIQAVKDGWEIRNGVWNLYPDHVPQAFGQGDAFRSGTGYAVSIARMFILIWIIILGSEFVFIFHFALPRCEGAPSVISCLLTDVGFVNTR